ncbi:FkbM family methyltransferase [Paracraurococcus lichenis]|uniref:FkbM family methyltransferase n=1 Tax=Paracraurococcus lichenis TaxID=3064888 RepID=A0ABT9E1G4_9PROT|nr:FkbM family methyltransferase [Paracraurococcus sp. LOR1-02]MDO9710003.1 FkbM family methyltransferase [Paracraurococcus sp. LOR1-02]
MIGTRAIRIGGRDWQVAGQAEDSFFAHAEAHATGMAEMAAVAAAVLPADGVALDIGANIGLSALALAPVVPRGRILAVEPSPRTHAALRETVAANGLGERVAVEAVALGAAPGVAEFHAAEHSAGAHLLDPATLGGESLPRVRVPVETVDALVARHGLARLDFMKVDVEGFETEVLDGAKATLARFRPVVFAEFNAWVLQCNRNANPRAVLEDWLARFPVTHALRGTAPPMRLDAANLLAFLHDHLVLRGCADELVMGFDEGWVSRWRPAA